MKVGEKVFWHDPDGGLCSGIYIVSEIQDDMAVIVSESGSESEVPLHELEVFED